MLKSKKFLISIITAVITLVITTSFNVFAAATEITAGKNEAVKLTMSDIAFGGVGQKSSFSFTMSNLQLSSADLTDFNVYFQHGGDTMYAITTNKVSIDNNKLIPIYNAVFKTVPQKNDKLIFTNQTHSITYKITEDDIFAVIPPFPTVTVKGTVYDAVFTITAEAGGTIYLTDGVIKKPVLNDENYDAWQNKEYTNTQSFNLTAAKTTIKISDLSDELRYFAISNGYIKYYYKNTNKYGIYATITSAIHINADTPSPTPTVTVNELKKR